MALLFYPFRNEHVDLLDHDKVLLIFAEHEMQLLRRRQEYEQYIDLEQASAENQELWAALAREEEETAAIVQSDRSVYDTTDLLQNHNDDVRQAEVPQSLSAVVKKRTNVMTSANYCAMMRKTNFEQRALIKHCIARLQNSSLPPVQVFFIGPAGCGKTLCLKLLMETYNRFAQSHDSQRDVFVATASTAKASVAIGGTTVHTAFHISPMARREGLTFEMLQAYRNAFVDIQLVIVDEISIIGAGTFHTINERLKKITHEHELPFGGIDIIFCGDLRQLPPVRATPIFEPVQRGFHRTVLWQSLAYYPLQTVMRQSNVRFSTILTKIGDGRPLDADKTQLLQDRFRDAEWCDEHVKDAIRLFHSNDNVEKYNRAVVVPGAHSIAVDCYAGYRDQAQLLSARTKVHKLSTTEAGNMPYDLVLAMGYPYMITSNLDLEDGLVNGAVGVLKYIEYEPDSETQGSVDAQDASIHCLWLEFQDNSKVGRITRSKCRPKVISTPHLNLAWTPIFKKKATITVSTHIKCRRMNFPLVFACAMTVHKSQGASFEKVVFEYRRSLQQQLLYVALSRVMSLEGLYLTNASKDHTFYHSQPLMSPGLVQLQNELQRLESYKLETVDHRTLRRLENVMTIILNMNVQSLPAHVQDLTTDRVLMKSTVLCLTETWMENEISVDIEGFHLIAQNKRQGKTGGVAIYIAQALKARSEALFQPQLIETDAGDICVASTPLNEQRSILVAVYINPQTSFADIKHFIRKYRHIFTEESCGVATPVLVSGDFNCNMKVASHRAGFESFMREEFGLTLASDPEQSTTNQSTCLDLVFTRNLVVSECFNTVSYFSYHTPMFIIPQ